MLKEGGNMNNFTIPSRANLKDIRSIQKIIEGYFYGTNRITDYAVLKGAGGPHGSFTFDKAYPYWLQNETDDYTNHDDLYYGVSPAQATDGAYYSYAYSEDKTVGTRLMLDYDTIIKYGRRVKKIKNNDNAMIDIYEYGKYPQSLVTDKEKDILNILYVKGLLKKTGRTYSYNIGSVDSSFSIDQDLEYEYNNQRYVRVKKINEDAILPNKTKLMDDHYWVKVEPIKWYVKHDTKTVVTAKTIIGGVPYNIKPVNGIANTYIGRFIWEVFSKDFNQDLDFSNSKNKTQISRDVIRVIKKTRNHNAEIDEEFAKCFDKKIKETKTTKVHKVKVKVKENNK